MYDVYVVHTASEVSVFYGTFASYAEAESFSEALDIDEATEHINITLCVVIT